MLSAAVPSRHPQGGGGTRGPKWTSLFGYMGRPEGNVHFAGEHTSTNSQGYLNGGVETGLRAAREVIHATGRGVRPLF